MVLVELVAVAVILAVTIGLSFIRGSVKSKVRLGLVLFSAITAFVTAMLIKSSKTADMLLAKLGGINIGEMTLSEILEQMAEYSPSLEKLIFGSVTALVSPLVFLAVFLAMLIVTWLIFFVVTLVLFPLFKKWEDGARLPKIQAMVVGVLQGVLILFFVISPVAYYANVCEQAIPAIKESGVLENIAADNGISVEEIEKNLGTSSDSVMIDVVGTCGGKAFSGMLSDFSFVSASGEKVKVNFGNEIVPIVDLTTNVMSLTGTPIEEFSQEQADAIENIGKKFSESQLVTSISCELVHGVTGAWKAGDSYAMLAKPEMEDPVGPVFDNLVKIFYESSGNSEYLGQDVQDLSKIVSVLVKTEALGSIDDIQQMLTKLVDGGAITDITAILSANPRLRPIIGDITNLSVYILADSLNVPKDEVQVYNNMLVNIADKLEDTRGMEISERIDAINEFIAPEFKAAGIEVDEEYVDLVATALVNDFGDYDGDITPEFIAEFFTIYSEYSNQPSGGNEGVVGNGSYGYVKLADTPKFTFPGYQNAEKRKNSGAAVIGKLDAEISNINSGTKTEEEKRKQLESAAETIMSPITEKIIEKSEDKEAAKQRVDGYKDTVNSISEKSGDTNSSSKLGSLSSADTATENINCITLDKIRDKFSSTQELADEEEAAKQSAVINEVLNCASVLLSAQTPDDGAPNTSNMVKAATEGLGKVLDTLSESKLYGAEDTAGLMTSILTSDTVGSMISISKSEALGIADNIKNDANVSYGSVMGGVSGVAELVLGMVDGSCTIEGVETMIKSLDSNNIDTIMLLISPERFTSMGLDSGDVGTTMSLMTSLLYELAAIPDDRVSEEAVAIYGLVNVASAAKGGGESLFGSKGVIGSASGFISDILASEAASNVVRGAGSNPFGVKLSDADVKEFRSAAERYMSGSDAAVVRGIAAVLGISL